MRPKRWRSDAMGAALACERSPRRITPGLRLGLVGVAVGVLWLVVLPRVAALPAVRAYIERNEAAGIDPAAKFYSEVPAMPRLLEQVRRDRAAEPLQPPAPPGG